MERSLEQPVVDPTYLEFFGLTQSPFARLPDPCQLFHSEQYSLLTEHLANAATHADSLVVICGADGSGKSTLLNRFVTTIGDQISCVVVDETCHGEEQFYSAFLTQIGFEEITGTANELRNITKEFLVCRGIANEHVLIIIDDAHLTDPRILEQLRWLCNIKIKDRRVLSVVLVGNADILRVVDAPAMRQINFPSHVAFGIRNYSEEETADYIWHRLRMAGGNDAVKIPNEASALIHRYSGGVPHLINRLCDDMLLEASGLESRVITEKIVRTVADKQQLLPHVVPLHGKGRRKSDPDFKHVRAVPKRAGVDSNNLQQQVARLSEQLGDLRADKARALEDIDVRNSDIVALRDEITQKNLALSRSATALEDSENRSKKFVADLVKETRAREAAEKELAKATATVEELNQLTQELQATVDDVQADVEAADQRAVEIVALEKNTATLKNELESKTGELDSLRDELRSLRVRLTSRDKDVAELEKWLQQSQKERAAAQLRINTLTDPTELKELEIASGKLATDLRKEARARKAAERDLAKATATIGELRQSKRELQATVRNLNADLRKELEKSTRALDSRDQALADLEKQLDASQVECDLLRRRAPANNTGEKIVAEQAMPASGRDARVHSSHVVAKFEQSLSNIAAYQTLREYDPAFYDGLIIRYKQLVGQDLTDKQVNDALRAEQARLMERLLPKASDETIITYAGLIIDQLDEFRLDGTEPCLSLLIPQSSPDNTSPVYSEITKSRELDILDIALRTYDADRKLPAEKDVWPDLGPIFEELFEEFGADNVAAMENSYDPGIDRGLVCNVTRALYSGILELPERNAASALRWLLTT